jgi:hypothetical protein
VAGKAKPVTYVMGGVVEIVAMGESGATDEKDSERQNHDPGEESFRQGKGKSGCVGSRHERDTLRVARLIGR